jgi:hypothetical protein
VRFTPAGRALLALLLLGGAPGLAGCTVRASGPNPGSPTGISAPGTSTGETSSGASPSAVLPVGPAADQLAMLPVKGRAPLTGYRRELFGQTWADVDRNGCDTRNDILRRDLTAQRIRPGTGGCVVLSGALADPYGGTVVAFARGGADDVEIDHVVALADAWATGAATWTAQRRVAFANDPVNLLAVSATTNRSKGESDAATWLPPDRRFRCAYAARQVAVKVKYGLWLTSAERAALAAVLGSCPGQPGVPAGARPTESEVGAATASSSPSTSLSPSPGSPSGAADGDTGTPVHPGALCSPPGATGRTEAGTPMRCTSTATDPRSRWRRG